MSHSPDDSGRRRTILTGGALVLAAGLPNLAVAQKSWMPTRDIHFYIGFPVGGSADVLCRLVADALRPIFGQTVIVDSKTGANGFIAAEVLSRAPADGHTVCFVTMGMMTIAPQLPGYPLPIDPGILTPIANIGGIPSILVTYPDAPFKTVPELIAYAKANPGKVTYASSGPGSTTQLAAELFGILAGVELLNVPYRGGGPAMIDLMAGRVQMMIGNMPDFVSQIQAGRLRAIAFGGGQTQPLFPDLPLINQYLTGFDVDNWFGIVGPPNMPVSIQNAWNEALQRVYGTPSVQKLLTANGFQTMIGPVEQFKAQIAASMKRWGGVIKTANIKS